MYKSLDNKIESNRVYTTGDVANILGICSRTVIKLFDKGELKGYHVPFSKDRRIPYKSLVEFMDGKKIPKKLIDIYQEKINKENVDDKKNIIYTSTEAAKICKVSSHTLNKWLDHQGLKGFIIGKSDRRIPHDNLVEFMKEKGIYEFLKDNFKLI